MLRCLRVPVCALPFLMGCIASMDLTVGVTGTGSTMEVVVRIPKAQLQERHQKYQDAEGYKDFPANESVFKHTGTGHNAFGHPPIGVNTVEHVDAHFYMIDNAAREAISCKDQPMPDESRIPRGATLDPRPETSGGLCVDKMGAHAYEPYDKLTAQMMYGYDQGKLIFYEPMIAMEKLLAEEAISLEIKQPDVVDVHGWYPTRFVVRYTSDEVQLVMKDFVDRR